MRTLRQYFLVSEMVGVEGHVCANFILMVANLQTLGVPIIYTSLPVICSAVLSLFLIPALGYINIQCALTLKLKAVTMVAVNFVQMTGSVLVILGNFLKLKENSELKNVTLSSLDNATESALNSTYKPSDKDQESIGIYLPPIGALHTTTMISVPIETSFVNEFPGLKMYAIIALIGYAMVDSGYDMSSCFLKTFAMACTPTRDQSSIIVKAILVSSLGGCLVTLLGSIGVGEMLSSSLSLDPNAVTSMVLYGICLILTVPTIVMSLVAGFCCGDQMELACDDGADNKSNFDDTQDERQSLMNESVKSTTSYSNNNNPLATDDGTRWQLSISSVKNEDMENSHRFSMSQSSITREVVERVWQLSQSGAHSLMEQTLSITKMHYGSTDDIAEMADSQRGCVGRLLDFLKRNRKRLNLCSANFFAVAAIFSFNLYSVNFVATSIFHGDAQAPIDSQQYANYSDGVKAGSTGILLCYCAFVVCTLSQAFLLNKIGWWRETVVVFVAYVISNVICATTKLIWAYYVTACLNGVFRAVVFTVPYILVCRVITRDVGIPSKSENDCSWDISLVAAMLPLCMAVYSPVMGPLLEVTGNAASPLYVTAASATLGLALFSLLRNY